MTCHQCGQTIAVTAKFCPFCGTVADQRESAQLSRLETKAPVTFKNKGLIILAVLLALLGGGFWAWQSGALPFLSSSSKTSKKIIAYPYQDAFGLNILNEDLEVVAQEVGADVVGFTAPVTYTSPFNEQGVAVIRDQNYLTWLVNHHGEIISQGYNTMNSNPFGGLDSGSGFDNISSGNGTHTASDEENYYLIDTSGDVIYQTDGVIFPFEGNEVTIINDYNKLLNNGTEPIKSGVISDSGELLIPIKYHYLSVVDHQHFIAKEFEYDQVYLLIDQSGQTLFEMEAVNPPIVTVTSEGVLISANNTWGDSSVYNLEGDRLLNVSYQTDFTATENGQYIYPGYLNDEEQQFIVYNGEGATHFQGDQLKNYRRVNENNRLAFSDYSGFGYIDLETRETHQVPYDMSSANFSFINNSNVGMINKEGEYLFFNSLLEEISLPETELVAHFVNFELDDVVYIYKKKGFYVLNKNGAILSEDAQYAVSQGDSVYIQENNGKAYLVNKETGKITKEKE